MPEIRLNAKSFENLEAKGSGRTDYYDEATPGMLVRVSPKDKAGKIHKSFIVVYRHKGRQRRLTLGSSPPLTLRDGRDLAIQALRDAALGEDPASAKTAARKAETFTELANEYLERYSKPRKKSWKEDERLINNVLIPVFGSVKAVDISRADIRRLLEKIAETAPVSANRTLAAVRKIFNWGVSQDIIRQNPCYMIAAPGEEKQRDRVLTEDEIKFLWTEFENEQEPVASTFKLRLLTAQRGGEVHSIEWKDLDLVNAWWTIPADKAKNGLAHRVPLSPPAIRIFHELRRLQDKSKTRKDSSWVFPARRIKGKSIKKEGSEEYGHLGSVQKAIERMRKRTGITDFRAHDLRRTAASLMTGMGIPRLTVSKILNHVESGVTQVYDRHSYDAEKRDALDKWARRLSVIISGFREVTNSRI